MDALSTVIPDLIGNPGAVPAAAGFQRTGFLLSQEGQIRESCCLIALRGC